MKGFVSRKRTVTKLQRRTQHVFFSNEKLINKRMLDLFQKYK